MQGPGAGQHGLEQEIHVRDMVSVPAPGEREGVHVPQAFEQIPDIRLDTGARTVVGLFQIPPQGFYLEHGLGDEQAFGVLVRPRKVHELLVGRHGGQQGFVLREGLAQADEFPAGGGEVLHGLGPVLHRAQVFQEGRTLGFQIGFGLPQIDPGIFAHPGVHIVHEPCHAFAHLGFDEFVIVLEARCAGEARFVYDAGKVGNGAVEGFMGQIVAAGLVEGVRFLGGVESRQTASGLLHHGRACPCSSEFAFEAAREERACPDKGAHPQAAPFGNGGEPGVEFGGVAGRCVVEAEFGAPDRDLVVESHFCPRQDTGLHGAHLEHGGMGHVIVEVFLFQACGVLEGLHQRRCEQIGTGGQRGVRQMADSLLLERAVLLMLEHEFLKGAAHHEALMLELGELFVAGAEHLLEDEGRVGKFAGSALEDHVHIGHALAEERGPALAGGRRRGQFIEEYLQQGGLMLGRRSPRRAAEERRDDIGRGIARAETARHQCAEGFLRGRGEAAASEALVEKRAEGRGKRVAEVAEILVHHADTGLEGGEQILDGVDIAAQKTLEDPGLFLTKTPDRFEIAELFYLLLDRGRGFDDACYLGHTLVQVTAARYGPVHLPLRFHEAQFDGGEKGRVVRFRKVLFLLSYAVQYLLDVGLFGFKAFQREPFRAHDLVAVLLEQGEDGLTDLHFAYLPALDVDIFPVGLAYGRGVRLRVFRFFDRGLLCLGSFDLHGLPRLPGIVSPLDLYGFVLLCPPHLLHLVRRRLGLFRAPGRQSGQRTFLAFPKGGFRQSGKGKRLCLLQFPADGRGAFFQHLPDSALFGSLHRRRAVAGGQGRYVVRGEGVDGLAHGVSSCRGRLVSEIIFQKFGPEGVKIFCYL